MKKAIKPRGSQAVQSSSADTSVQSSEKTLRSNFETKARERILVELDSVLAEPGKPLDGQGNCKESREAMHIVLEGIFNGYARKMERFGVFMDCGFSYGSLCRHFGESAAKYADYAVCGVEYNSTLFSEAMDELNPTRDFTSRFQFRRLNAENVAEFLQRVEREDSSQTYLFYGDATDRSVYAQGRYHDEFVAFR
eukprot:TRINITY_DN3216_c0_g1_i2.p1 TRINITY_DN3216_c0_g1~~TRINITY_DN3216_c0_g1_i2.p1  ORF type:complete len:195 (-),score=17.45 TRINITY_DN3216_c0_g1_i2:186-770(-)